MVCWFVVDGSWCTQTPRHSVRTRRLERSVHTAQRIFGVGQRPAVSPPAAALFLAFCPFLACSLVCSADECRWSGSEHMRCRHSHCVCLQAPCWREGWFGGVVEVGRGHRCRRCSTKPPTAPHRSPAYRCSRCSQPDEHHTTRLRMGHGGAPLPSTFIDTFTLESHKGFVGPPCS